MQECEVSENTIYNELTEKINPKLENIRKSYKRGFTEHKTEELRTQINELVKNYVICAWHYRDSEFTKQKYQLTRKAYNQASERLKIDDRLPEQLPSTIFPTVVPTLAALATAVFISSRKPSPSPSPLSPSDSPPKHTTRMAAFDFNIGFKLPELSSSKATDVNTFLAAIKVYHDSLSADGKTMLINFVLAAKILKEAKTRLGTTKVESFEQLKTACLSKILAAETAEEVTRKIRDSFQGRRSVQDYASHLQQLAARLAATMSKATPTLDEATTIHNCEQLALSQFKIGCKEELRLVVAAARPTTLDDAVAVASSSNLEGQFPVNYLGHGRGRGRGRGQWRGQQRQFRPQNQNWQQNNQQFQGRGQRQFGPRRQNNGQRNQQQGQHSEQHNQQFQRAHQQNRSQQQNQQQRQFNRPQQQNRNIHSLEETEQEAGKN